MSKDAIQDRVFPVRSKAVLALRAASSKADAETFLNLTSEAKNLATAFGRAPSAKRWTALASALDIVRLLVEWEQASLSAAVEPNRFLRAARLCLRQLREGDHDTFSEKLIATLSVIDSDMDFSAIGRLRQQIAEIPLPIGIYADPVPDVPDWAHQREQTTKEKAPDLTVAFVEFKINGTTAERIQALRPRESHDLDIAVRVSRWPDAATALVISPISIEPASNYDLPSFRFPRPSGEAPFFFQQRGRMTLHVSQNLKARPFEFVYTAEFQPVSTERPVSIAGQRRLRLDGSAFDHKITGYRDIDAQVLAIRDQLRFEPQVAEEDIDQLLTVLVPLANLMGQSVQDNKFPTVVSEAEFQKQVRERLRQVPEIGSLLEEQAQSTGGRTDLSFKGIRIELKSETAKRLVPDDCKKYASQAASYAIGTNRRIAVLCVLDCSPKTEMPFPMQDGLSILPIDTGRSPVYIVTVLIQGNIPRPSSHSR